MLFVEALESREREAMSDKLVAVPRPVIFKPGKPVFPTEKMTANPKMDNLVRGMTMASLPCLEC